MKVFLYPTPVSNLFCVLGVADFLLRARIYACTIVLNSYKNFLSCLTFQKNVGQNVLIIHTHDSNIKILYLSLLQVKQLNLSFMICYGYRSFNVFEVVYHSYYSQELHKFECWQVIPLLGEWEVPSDFQETFDRLDKSIYKF